MALQDPETGLPIDPVVADALFEQQQQQAYVPFDWVPDEWRISAGEYGATPGVTPPPPPVKNIGPAGGVVEETAGPVPAAFDPTEWRLPSVDLSSLQPPGAEPGRTGPPAGEQAPDPWAQAEGGLDEPRAQHAIDRAGSAIVEPASEMLASDPWKLMEVEGRNELERANQQRDALIEEARRSRADADRNAQQLQEAHAKAQVQTDQIVTEATALANKEIIRDRRSTGRKFADVLLAAAGGLVAGANGGPNVGLQLVLKRMEDDVQGQKDDIGRKQSLLGMRKNFVAEELARSGDMFKAQEMYRLALHDSAIAEINNEAMKYNPNGTRAIQLAKLKLGIAQSKQAAVDSIFQRNLKLAHDQAQIEGMLIDNAQKRAKLAGMGAGGGPTFAPTEKDFASVTPPPGFKGTPKQWIDLRNSYLEGKVKEQTVASGGELGKEQRDRELKRGGLGLFDYDKTTGQKVEFVPHGTDTEVAEFRNRNTGTPEIAHLLDEAMSIRTGWTSDKLKSDENVRLKAIMGRVMVAAKKAETLGAITESDLKLIEGIAGTGDFTSWRGVEAGVNQARKNLIDNWRNAAIGVGMSKRAAGELNIANPYEGTVKVSREDSLYQGVLSGEVTGSQKTDVMNSIYGLARSSDPTLREKGLARLRKIATDAPDEVDRRSVSGWLKSTELGGPGDGPLPPPQTATPVPSKPTIVQDDPVTYGGVKGQIVVMFPDGTKRVMSPSDAATAVAGGK